MNISDIEKIKQRVLTLGWGIVGIIIILMNVYVWDNYLSIQFPGDRISKIIIYNIIHLILFLSTTYYFALFFSGNTETKQSKVLSKVAGFYITALSYSVILFLLLDISFIFTSFLGVNERTHIWLNYISIGGFIIFIPAGIIAFYSVINSKYLQIKEYNIEVDKKNSKLDSLNLVYISDAHIGTAVNRDNIDDIIKKIKNLKPDILLLGGDFFDEGTKEETKKVVARKIKEIKTRYGIYGIEGNHEYKNSDSRIDDEMRHFERENIKILQDEVLEIKDSFYVVGRKDKMGEYKDLKDTMNLISKDIPIILLDHRPSFKDSMNYDNIDVQIAGHTHNGQFFPLGIFNYFFGKIRKEYFYGYHKIGRLHHIVSSGIGTWGVPVRLGSKREIVNIKINFK